VVKVFVEIYHTALSGFRNTQHFCMIDVAQIFFHTYKPKHSLIACSPERTSTLALCGISYFIVCILCLLSWRKK